MCTEDGQGATETGGGRNGKEMKAGSGSARRKGVNCETAAATTAAAAAGTIRRRDTLLCSVD